jgi:para-nitrobenzyl esterase
MFDNLAYKKWAWTDWDRKLTDIMSSYWLNFINKGDPNGPGLPAWAKFTTTGQETIQFGDSVAPFRGPREVLNFFEKMPGTVGP